MSINKIYILVIFFLSLSYLIISIIVKPSMYNDSALGFITMKSMLSGAPFNYMNSIDAKCINENTMAFNGTWAPGQYLVPMLFIKYIGLNIGESIVVTNFLMNVLGLLGFYYLFLALEFNKKITLITLLIIVCQRFHSISYSLYNGGETILFGTLPWILLCLTSVRYNRILDFFYFIILCYIGFLSKFSFIIVALALAVYLVIHNLKLNHKIFISEILLRVLKFGGLFLTFFTICYFTFISKGLYSTQTFSYRFSLTNSLFVFAEPMGSILSIDDLYQRLFEFPGYNISPSTLSTVKPLYYLVIAIISSVSIFRILNLNVSYKYKSLLISFLITFVAIFLVFYNKEEITSSMEMRHFRSAGFLMLPGIISYLIDKKKTFFGYLLVSIIFVSCLYGITSFLQRERGLLANSAIGYNGFRNTIIDKTTLTFVKGLDSKNNTEALIYVPDAAVALEFDHLRTLISHADFEQLSDLKMKTYSGKASKLYVLIQSRFSDNGKTKAILNSFRDYQNFTILFKNDEFTVFEGLN